MTSTSLQFTCRLPESCDFVATTTIVLSATQNGDFAGLLFTKYGTSKTHMYINPFSPSQDKHQVPNHLLPMSLYTFLSVVSQLAVAHMKKLSVIIRAQVGNR